MESKANRSVSILERLAEERPEDPHGPFFLCKTYRAIGDSEQVLHWGRRCRELVGNDPRYAILWAWMFHAALALDGPDSAETILQEAEANHTGLADLHHCRMMLAAYRWQEAARSPGQYAYTPQATLRYVNGLPEASTLLGLAFQFEQRSE